ncbi:MAG: T9SS type A sorting domain-containing protein [Bacteroidia bacterium]
MRKSLLLGIFLLIQSVFLFSQTFQSNYDHNRAIQPFIDSAFNELDTSRIPGGILLDKTVCFSLMGKYDGKKDTVADFKNIRQACLELRNAAYNRTSFITPGQLYENSVAQYNQGIMPVEILAYDYARFTDEAYEHGLVTINDAGHFVDALQATPYESKSMFMMSPFSNKSNFSDVRFLIDPQFIHTNFKSSISAVNVDFDDGNGMHPISYANSSQSAIQVIYSSTGLKTITIQIVYSNTLSFRAKSTLDILSLASSSPSGTFRTIPIPPSTTAAIYEYYADATSFVPRNFSNTIPQGKALVSITYGTNSTLGGCLKSPLIFLDGIDFGTSHYAKNGDLGFVDILNGNNTDYPALSQGPQMLGQMWQNGYDVVFVDFYEGAGKIEDLSDILINIINHINAMKCADADENVVVGPSMGGQVSLIALAKMEQQGMPHCTREYVSFDSPHEGANVPIGAQFMIDFMASVSVDAAGAQAQLNTYGAQELLLYHSGYAGLASPLRGQYVAYRNSLGYPQHLRKVSVINGSNSALDQGFTGGAPLVDWHHSMYAGIINLDAHVWATPGASTVIYAEHNNTSIYHNVLFYGQLADFSNFTLTQWHEIDFTSSPLPPIDGSPGGVDDALKAFDMDVEIGNSTYGHINVYNSGRYCFIPSISSLDLNNTNNYFYNIGGNINPSPNIKNYSPFDDYFSNTSGTGGASLNQLHVTVEVGVGKNTNWLISDLLLSQNTLGVILNNTYNFGLWKKTLHSTTIVNNGILKVNSNQSIEYGTGPVPPQNSLHILNTNGCGAVVDIQQGGKMEVGDPSVNNRGEVHFLKGSILHIENGGKLTIRDGSKLIIEEGARIIYEQGAQIELLGNNAVLEIKGILELGANADFTFTYPNAVSGYVRFSRASYVPYDINDPTYQIVAPPSASIHFLGLNRTDKVLEIDQSGLWIPDWLTTFSVINGKVFFGSVTSNPILAIGSPVVLKFSDFETQPPAMGQGVCLFGQSHVVQGCHFTNLQTGLTALNFYWGTPLKVTSSTFTGCGTGINVVDKGVKILACTFDNCGNGLVASGLTFPSLADATTFTNCVYDGAYLNNNPVEFLFSGCIANNNYQAGIESYGSTVNLRCNDIKQNTNWGVYIGYNGIVSANPTFGGGYNDMRFNGSSTGYFDEAGGFEFNGGYNYLKQASSSQGCDNLGIGCPTVFEGSIISSCPSNTWQTIPAYNNYWKNNLSNENVTWPPSSSSHYLDLPLSSNQLVEFPCGRFIRVSDPSQQNFLYCPTIQPPQQLTPLDNCPDCNAISTTSFSDTLSNDATRLAISKMDTTVPNGYSNAVGLLNEILLYPNANPSDGDIYVRNTGLRKMHDAFGAGMDNDQIPADSLSTQAMQVIQAEQDEKQDGISNGDYVKRFFASMHEAMAYRAAGKRDLALVLFYDIQTWAETVHQPYVSYWICLTNNENLVLTGQMPKEEFITALQLCGTFSTAVPTLQSRVGNVSSPADETPGTMNTLTVFPNPANESATLIFNQSNPKITGMFAIYNLEGELINTQLLSGGTVSHLDLSGLASGLYLCTISVNGEITDRQRLAVSH